MQVPATDMEALKSPLMGMFEKRRARSFFIFVQDYELDEPTTLKGMDLTRVTKAAVYQKVRNQLSGIVALLPYLNLLCFESSLVWIRTQSSSLATLLLFTEMMATSTSLLFQQS